MKVLVVALDDKVLALTLAMALQVLTLALTLRDKNLIRKWDSERELSLRRLRTRTTKYNRLVHKFRHR